MIEKCRFFFKLIVVLLIGSMSVVLPGCNQHNSSKKLRHCEPVDVYHPKYAKGFWIEYFNGFKVVHLRDAYDTTKVIEDYVIYPAGKKKPSDWPEASSLFTPAGKSVCLSTTQIGLLDVLGLTDSIAGIVDRNRIYNPRVLKEIENGSIKVVGSNSGTSAEDILLLQPSVVLAYSFNEGNSIIPKLKSLGLSILLINDYNEKEPLARAEWIKVVAALYDRDEAADSIFRNVEAEYNSLKSLASGSKQRPTVFCNLPWNDVWYMPGGDSYFANFIADAGGVYLWSDKLSQRVLNLDYEAVFAKASDADVLLNPNEAKTLNDINILGKRFENFNAVQLGKVYNYNNLTTASGGNDFWERGVVHPHLVLKDLVSIFHPELLPNHQLIYYKQLR